MEKNVSFYEMLVMCNSLSDLDLWATLAIEYANNGGTMTELTQACIVFLIMQRNQLEPLCERYIDDEDLLRSIQETTEVIWEIQDEA